jgi:hypothetical protein
MELDATTGKRMDAATTGAPWDINGDGKIDTNDLIILSNSTDSIAPSGKQSTIGGVNTPGVISDGKLEYKYTSGSNKGETEVTRESGSTGTTSTGSRQSWRQIH